MEVMERTKTMKRVYSMLAVSLFVVATATSCAEKDDTADIQGDGYVDFSVGSSSTRTVRDDDNKYQINWVFGKENTDGTVTGGDKVRIYCNEADKAVNANGYADYTVMASDVTHDNESEQKKSGKLRFISEGLAWNETYQLHHFYAAYPADDAKVTGIDYTNKTITFKSPTSQTVEVTSETGEEGSKQYTCAPVMSNAYMVAQADAHNGSKVALEFKPIMTTLDVTLVNNSKENQSTISVTGFSVIDENASGNDEFKYDVANGKLYGAATTTSTQTTFVSLKHGDDYFLDLANGESVSFTVFLPPVPINESRQLKLRVHCTGAAPKIVTIGGTATDANGQSKTLSFAASSLGNVKLNVKKTEDSNNWITPLDDNIYVQQLSIPGSNEAISYFLSTSKSGRMQDKTILEQLNMGVRAFDIHMKRASGSSYNLYAGGDDLSETVNQILGVFKEWLSNEKNKREFVVLNFTPHRQNLIITNYYDDFADRLSSSLGSDYMVQWKKDLTIDDCRGRAVIITRYGDSSDASNVGSYPGRVGSEYAEDSYTIGNVKSTTLNSPISSTTLNYFARNSGDNYQSNTETRMQYVADVLEQSKKNASNFPWSICYVAGSDQDDSSVGNAEKMHPRFFKWINEQTDFGPLGIVFMDYMGARTYSSKTIYGDLLPQAIIDNNYRFTMKRYTGN